MFFFNKIYYYKTVGFHDRKVRFKSMDFHVFKTGPILNMDLK